MKEMHLPVTEDEIHAYVDGELPNDRIAAVETWLACHPEDAARVTAWRAMAERLHQRYGNVVNESVPSRLQLEHIIGRPRRWLWGAIAASIAAFAVGAILGWTVHSVTATPPALVNFTDDAMQAHQLYVVEVRHPVEVAAGERQHLQQWLSKRVGYAVRPPDLERAGLKLVGGRLLPGPEGPAAFFMYEGASGDRFTIYSSRVRIADTQMHYVANSDDASMFWCDSGVSYALSGPPDRTRLQQIASVVYEEVEKAK
jgi:anti-sigma factor RsiW